MTQSIANWIDGALRAPVRGEFLPKYDPHSGQLQAQVARSFDEDVEAAVASAEQAFKAWSELPGVRRGQILYDVAFNLKAHREEMARIVASETGKSLANALAETDGAIALGLFMAGEGQRLYGRTTTSGNPNRQVMTIREPLGIAGLIIAANTPIANVAWKVFPALVCGNSAILKAAEDTPATALRFAELATAAGLPPGVLNVLQGYGREAGTPLVSHRKVAVVSFTGSTKVGREIAEIVGRRLGRLSLELGGKNAFVVCDDADLDNAVHWAVLSAFSNAGQRCAAGSRILVMSSVYERFRDQLLERTKQLKVGPSDTDDFGPVINKRQLEQMIMAVEEAVRAGAKVLVGGHRLDDVAHAGGYYMSPTLLENVAPNNDISQRELFGPISNLYKVDSLHEALNLANSSPYGLTAAIHTRNISRAMWFAQRVQAGVVGVNAGTFGSEPHMPFGGVKDSGNGTREPGTEALDIYSNLKAINVAFDPRQV